MHRVDVTALLLRATLGVTMAAHGWNHAFDGGKLTGTAGVVHVDRHAAAAGARVGRDADRCRRARTGLSRASTGVARAAGRGTGP
jgi:uncharacterized membrane protein YphA (DoxX/SURF4 family)